MWRFVAIVLVVLAAAPAALAADPELTTEQQRTLYALGVSLHRYVGIYNLREDEIELVKAGLTDAVLNRSKVDPDAFIEKIADLVTIRVREVTDVGANASKPFLEQAAAQPGAKTLESGLIYSEIRPGTGEAPSAASKVKIHYHGTLTDGTVFDSSVQRGQPATVRLSRVIECWGEGIQQMKVGGKSKLVCPGDIAFGLEGAPPLVKPGVAVVYEVELLEVGE